MKILISLVIVLFVLTGCNQSETNYSNQSSIITSTHNPTAETNYSNQSSIITSTHNSTAEEILAHNPDADIFLYKEIIYQNASSIEWVQLLDLTMGEHAATIKNQYKEDLIFDEEMATKLPIGTEVFNPSKTKGPILIVNLDGQEIRYLGLIEG